MAKKPRWKVILKYLTRSSKDPESLARGVGLGLFVGLLPSVGFQVILAFLLAGFLNANRIIAVFLTLISNPFTALPLGAFSVWVGDLILPGSIIAQAGTEFSWSGLTESPSQLGLAYLTGCLSLSVIAGTLGYALMRVYHLFRNANNQSMLRDENG